MCICHGCPTYRTLGKEDDNVAYCFPQYGRSKNITVEKGCICGTCPVYSMNKYMTNYYCTRGLEVEQRKAIAAEVQTGRDALQSVLRKP